MKNAFSNLEKLPKLIHQEYLYVRALLQDPNWIEESKQKSLELFHETKIKLESDMRAFFKKFFSEEEKSEKKSPARKMRKKPQALKTSVASAKRSRASKAPLKN